MSTASKNNQPRLGPVKSFSYSVTMHGFDSVTGTITASNEREAKEKAVVIFEQRNGLDEDEEPGPIAARVRFYGPKVKPAN